MANDSVIDPALADFAFDSLVKSKTGEAEPAVGEAAYNDLRSMGFSHEDIQQNVSGMAPKRTPAPRDEGPGLISRAWDATKSALTPADEQPAQPGLLEPGNIDLASRPLVHNDDGSYSTVRSTSFGHDGKEILVPTVSPDGRIMSEAEAEDRYHRTGEHLGKFDSPENADIAAQAIHENLAANAHDVGKRSHMPPTSETPEQLAARASLPDMGARRDFDTAGAADMGGSAAPDLPTATGALGAAWDRIKQAADAGSAVIEDALTASPTINSMAGPLKQGGLAALRRAPRRFLQTGEDLARQIGSGESQPNPVADALQATREYAYPDTQETPENAPKTAVERVTSGIVESGGDLPYMALFTHELGPVLGFAAYNTFMQQAKGGGGATTPVEPGQAETSGIEMPTLDDAKAFIASEKMKAGVEGAVTGGAMHAAAPLGRVTRALTIGGAQGASSLAGGADPEQALESAAQMGAFAAMGGPGEVGNREAVGMMRDEAGNLAQRAKDRAAVAGMGLADDARTLKTNLGFGDNGEPVDTGGEPGKPPPTPYDEGYQRLRDLPAEMRARGRELLDRRAATGGGGRAAADEDAAAQAAQLTAEKEAGPVDEDKILLHGDATHTIPGVIGVVGSARTPLVDLTQVELHQDVMQYKRTTNALRGVTVFDPVAASNPPVLLYWNAPERADGQVGDNSLWAVDSNNRVLKAHELGARVPVKAEIIDGSKFTPLDARNMGALQNMRLNSGTALDAARVLREMGLTHADLQERGIPVNNQVLSDGMGIAQLNDALYRKVSIGEMTEKRAAMIGRELPDHDAQDALLEMLGPREKKGRTISDSVVEDMVRQIQNSPEGQARASGQTVFGGGDKQAGWGGGSNSLVFERAQLSSAVLKSLHEDAREWGKLGDEDLAKRAAEIGGTIDTVEGQRRAEIAAHLEGVYKKLSAGVGPIGDILNGGAAQIRAGEKVGNVKNQVYDQVRDAVLAEFPGGQRPADTGGDGAGDLQAGLFGGAGPAIDDGLGAAATEPGQSGEAVAPRGPGDTDSAAVEAPVVNDFADRAQDTPEMADQRERAAGLTDAELLQAVKAFRRGVALGNERDVTMLPIYEQEIKERAAHKTFFAGEEAEYGAGVTVDDPVAPKWETEEAQIRFTKWVPTLGDVDLVKMLDKTRDLYERSKNPAHLARVVALEGELERRNIPNTAPPPPVTETTPGSEMTKDELTRLRARALTGVMLQREIRSLEHIVERPALSAAAERNKVSAEGRLKILREVADERDRGATEPPAGKKRPARKNTDPEQMGRLGGIDAEDEPVGPSAYARRDGVSEPDYTDPGVKAAVGQPQDVETPTAMPDGIPERTEPAAADELPLVRTGLGSIFGLRRPGNEDAVREIVRRSDIVRALAEKLKIPIRVGRISMKNALGIFKIRPEVIRTRLANDIGVIAHEIGHYIDKRVFSNPPMGPGGKPLGTPVMGQMGGIEEHLFDAFASELHPLATPGMPGPEGFAEFVSGYVVDPARVARMAPNFYKFFERALDRAAPEIKDALLEARRDYARYVEQPAVSKALSMISVGERRAKGLAHVDIYHHLVDDLVPLKRYRDQVAAPDSRNRLFKQELFSSLDALDDPYTMQRLLAGWVGKANAFIQKGAKGALDFATLQRVHAPLEEVLQGVEDFQMLRAYMYARRTLEVANRAGGRVETGLEPTDARQVVKETETKYPDMARAFAGIRGVQDAALKYLADSGRLTQADYYRIRELNRDYVPLFRVLEDDVEAGFKRSGGGSGTSVVDLFNPIYKIKGSSRDVIDPLESVIKNIYTYVHLAERNQVGQSLFRLARRTHGSGFGVEEIPQEMVPKVMLRPDEIESFISRFTKREVSTEISDALQSLNETSSTTSTGPGGGPAGGNPKAQKLVEDRVLEALRARGFAEGEAQQMVDRIKNAPSSERETIINREIENVRIVEIKDLMKMSLPTDLVPVFRPELVRKNEPIVSVYFEPDKANRIPRQAFLRVSPEIYQAVKGLDRESASSFVRFLSPLARTLRAGVVLSPEFGLANIARDQATAFLQSRYGYVPAFDLIRGIGHLIRNTELVKDYYVSGAAMSDLTGLDREYLQRGVRQVMAESGGRVPDADMKNLGIVDRTRLRIENAASGHGTAVGRGVFLLTHPIEALRVISELSENATRLGEYDRAMKYEGKKNLSRRELMARAGIAGREVTIDFARAGVTGRSINQAVAFWNVAIQGPDRMIANWKRDPVGFSTRALIGITLPAVALWAVNHDDPRYKQLDARTRDLHFVYLSGTMTDDQWNKMTSREKAEYGLQHPIYIMPKAYEPGLIFGSLVERALDYFYMKDPKAMTEWAGSVFSSVSPGVIPTALGPVLEAAMNYSFFRGAKLVPRSLEDVEARAQKSGYTSKLAVKIADGMSHIPMPYFIGNTLGLQSPLKIENYIRGYTGGMGRLSSDAADAIINSGSTEIQPERTLADIPIIRRFVRRYPISETRSVEDFYTQYQASLEATATKEHYQKTLDMNGLHGVLEDRSFDLNMLPLTAAVAADLSRLRALADAFRSDTRMNAHEKSVAVNATTFDMVARAKAAMDAINGAREHLGTMHVDLGVPEQEPTPTSAPIEPSPRRLVPTPPPNVMGDLRSGKLRPTDLAGIAQRHQQDELARRAAR